MAKILGQGRAAIGNFWCYGSHGTSALMVQNVGIELGDAVACCGYIDDFVEPGPHASDPVANVHLEAAIEKPELGVLPTIYAPASRRAVISKLREAEVEVLSFHGRPRAFHPSTVYGDGVYVVPHCVVGPNVELGEGAFLLSSTLAHHVIVGEYATLGAFSIILGHVNIGADAVIGAGAIINNGTPDREITIGAGAYVGSGAVVDRDVPPGAVVVGPRAMPIPQWKWLRRFVEERSTHD